MVSVCREWIVGRGDSQVIRVEHGTLGDEVALIHIVFHSFVGHAERSGLAPAQHLLHGRSESREVGEIFDSGQTVTADAINLLLQLW